MTVKVEIASDNDATTWEDITDQVNLETAHWAGTASRGEIDTGTGFDWRDDAGTRVIPWRRRIRVTETSTTPDTIIWQGRTVGDEVRRGTIKTGDAKQFDVNCVDVNADFGGMPFAGTSRPAESDVDRIRYLLDTYLQGQNRPSTVIGDTYFNESIPYNLVAHVYENVQLIDWFTHVTDITGRDFFLTRDYDLWHDIPASTSYASGLSITDVSPNYSTSFPPILPDATEDATEMFTGVRYRYSGGRTVNVVRSAIELANDQWRTVVVDESITSATLATSKANVFLDQFDHSRTSFRCAIEIPATLVDQISWGMTISFRSAACGILSPTTYRITRLSWQLVGEGLWLADMEINYASKFRRATGGGGGAPTTPFVPDVVPDTTDLNLLYGTVSDGGGSRPFTNPTNANDNDNSTETATGTYAGGTSTGILKTDLGTARTVTSMVIHGEQSCASDPTAGAWEIESSDNGSSWTAVPTSKDWNGLGLENGVTTFTLLPASHRHWRIVFTDSAPGGFHCGSDIYTWAIFGGTASAPVPTQGTTEEATGDGVTTVFQTNFPYYENSLVVTVGGLAVVVEQTDPDTGTFTLPFAPDTGVQIVMTYQVAPGDATSAGNGAPTPVAPSLTIDWGEDADITTLDYDDVADAGVLDEVARADHRHGMPSASGGSLTVEENGGTPTVTSVDHIVFAASGDATVDVVDDTGGQVTVTIGATGTGGGTDPIEDTFGTPDTPFEFNANDFTGLTSFGTPDVAAMHTTVAGHLLLADDDSTQAGYYASVSTPFSAIVKITDFVAYENYQYVGMMIGVGSPGNIETISLLGGASPSLVCKTWAPFSTGSPGAVSITRMPTDPVGFTPWWIGVVVASSTDVSWYVSRSGIVWQPMVLNRNPGITVASVGVSVGNYAGGTQPRAAGAYDYLRIWNSALTFPAFT